MDSTDAEMHGDAVSEANERGEIDKMMEEQGLGGVELARVVDSRLDASKPERTMVAFQGPSSVTYETVNADSPSSTRPVFSVQVPSHGTGLSREVIWYVRGSCVIRGQDLQELVGANSRLSLRANPLHSITQTMSVSLNNTTISIDPAEYIAALSLVNRTSKSSAGVMSLTSSSPDMFADLEDADSNGPFRPALQFGYNSYAMNSRRIGITDTTLNPVPVSGGPPSTELTVNFEISELLQIPPFQSTDGGQEAKALFGLNKAQFRMSFGGNLHRLFTVALGGTAAVINSVDTLNLVEQSLQVSFITPSAVEGFGEAGEEIQRPFHYSLPGISDHTTSLSTANVPAGGQVSGSGSTVIASNIPHKILIWATYASAARINPATSLADMFMPIESISLTVGGRSGILAGSSPRQLYLMSYRNGISLPWSCWSGASTGYAAGSSRGAGGPLLLDVGSDIPLAPELSPGMPRRIQISVQSISVRNPSKRQMDGGVTLHMLFITNGVITLQGGNATVNGGPVPSIPPALLPALDAVQTDEIHQGSSDDGFGGRKGRGRAKARRFFRRLARGLRDTVLPIEEGLASMTPFGPAVKAVGKEIRKLGGTPLGGTMLGGTMLGGRDMTPVGLSRMGMTRTRSAGGRAAPRSMLG